MPRDDVADDNGVVANLDNAVQAALDNCERSGQYRGTGLAWFPIDVFEAALGLFGERDREFALLFGQDIDGEKRFLPEMIYCRAAEIDADENQWGLDGNGRKRTDGQSMRLPAGRGDGGYCYAIDELRTEFTIRRGTDCGEDLRARHGQFLAGLLDKGLTLILS